MAGVGKSTVGLSLAQALGFDFIDLDKLLQDQEGKTIQGIIDDRGEQKLLELEQQAMYEIDLNRKVVSPGGSLIYNPEIMEYLKSSSCLIYLHDTFENINKRLFNSPTRGIVGLKHQTLKEIYEERLPLYSGYADITIDVAGKTKEEVIKEIGRKLKRQNS
jgi:shikimate kinase